MHHPNFVAPNTPPLFSLFLRLLLHCINLNLALSFGVGRPASGLSSSVEFAENPADLDYGKIGMAQESMEK
jgi:hypothetical protein